MNKQIEKDLKRRAAIEKKDEKLREKYKKLPSYRGVKPANIWVFPLMVVCIKACDFWDTYIIGKWSEEKGKQFLDKYWMRRMDYDEDENVYLFCSSWYDWGWSKVTKNPIKKKWARKYGFGLNRIVLDKWIPEGFDREVIKDNWSEKIIKFIPKSY